MLLRFNINIQLGAVAANANITRLIRLARFTALRAINTWNLSHQGRNIDGMAHNLDLLRIYYNMFLDDESFNDTLHMNDGDADWSSEIPTHWVRNTDAAGAAANVATNVLDPDSNAACKAYTSDSYHEVMTNSLVHFGHPTFYVGGNEAAGMGAQSTQHFCWGDVYTAVGPTHSLVAGTIIQLPVQLVIPWWGGWRTNNVLPIRNLNSQPRLDIQFQANMRQTVIDNLYDHANSGLNAGPPALVANTNAAVAAVYASDPVLRCLYYRIPENIFATDFAFADQKNWIKPDYQHWQQERTFIQGDNQFYVNTINQDVRSLVVVVRKMSDLNVGRYDDFLGRKYFSHMYLKHGNEYIGPRFDCDTNFLMKYLKRKFYSRNTKDLCQDDTRSALHLTDAAHGTGLYVDYPVPTLTPEECPIFAFCFGMSGDINQPGMGSINFNDLLQNLTLTIRAINAGPAGDPYRVEVFALTNNIVTYDKGELMRQL